MGVEAVTVVTLGRRIERVVAAVPAVVRAGTRHTTTLPQPEALEAGSARQARPARITTGHRMIGLVALVVAVVSTTVAAALEARRTTQHQPAAAAVPVVVAAAQRTRAILAASLRAALAARGTALVGMVLTTTLDIVPVVEAVAVGGCQAEPCLPPPAGRFLPLAQAVRQSN